MHVIDAASADRERRMAAVRTVLREVGAGDAPIVEAYNKCDRLTPDERQRLLSVDPPGLCLSALTGEGVAELRETIASRLSMDLRRITITLDADAAAAREQIARIYRHGRVLLHETRDGSVTIVADVPPRLHPSLFAPRTPG